MFDALYEDAHRHNEVVIMSGGDDDTAAYAAVNERIIAEALALVREHASMKGSEAPSEQATAVIVWDGASPGAGDMTAAFANQARTLGVPIMEVNTLSPIDVPSTGWRKRIAG